MSHIERKGSMPWYCYTGFNVLVLWNFVSFSLDSTQVFSRGVALDVTSVAWISFAIAQAIGMIALTALSRTARMRSAFASSRATVSAAAFLASLGTILMTWDITAIGICGAIVSGLSVSWLWASWAQFYAALETGEAEHAILRSMFVSVVGAAVLLALPATIRFLCAQAIPLLSAACSIAAASWSAKRTPHLHEPPAEEKPSKDTLAHSVLSLMYGPADRPESTIRIAKMAMGLTAPAFCVFLITPFVANPLSELGTQLYPLVVLSSFLLAALLTWLFLRVSPSVTLAFIFRWQMPLIALACSLIIIGAPMALSSLALNAALIVISEFTWICLCRAMRTNAAQALTVFLGGYALFDVGSALGSLAAAGYTRAFGIAPIPTMHISGVALLLIVVALVVMLPGLASNRQAKGATTTTPVPNPATAINSAPEASAQLDAPMPKEKATPAEGSDEPIEPDEEFYRFYGITPREREIIAYLMRGRSVPYIRDELFISQNTVKTHIKHIYAKTNVGSRQELLDLIESMRP